MDRKYWLLGLGVFALLAAVLVGLLVVVLPLSEQAENGGGVVLLSPTPAAPASLPPEPVDTAAENEVLTVPAEDSADAMAVAEGYQALLPDTSGLSYVSLSAEEMAALQSWMGQQGYAATDAEGALPMTQSAAARAYAAAPEGSFTCYQLCYDGGLIQNRFRAEAWGLDVTQVRVYWQEGAVSLGYQERYALSSLTAENGVLEFVRIIPGNPASGSTHDGYIDPVVRLALEN